MHSRISYFQKNACGENESVKFALTCNHAPCGRPWHIQCSSTETPAGRKFCTQRYPASTSTHKYTIMPMLITLKKHGQSVKKVDWRQWRLYLVDVFCSSPGEAASVITAQDVEGRVIWIGAWRTDHLHEHGRSILFLSKTRFTYTRAKDPYGLRMFWNKRLIYLNSILPLAIFCAASKTVMAAGYALPLTANMNGVIPRASLPNNSNINSQRQLKGHRLSFSPEAGPRTWQRAALSSEVAGRRCHTLASVSGVRWPYGL